MSDQDADQLVQPGEILIVRRGPGANCSSIGSALELLFLSATIAGAVFAGVAAALGEEDIPKGNSPEDDPSKDRVNEGTG